MGDIDFDELDKAVSSLMGNVPKEDDETPKQKTLSISSTLGPGEKPAYDKLEAVAKTIGSETLEVEGERTIIEDLDPNEQSASDLTPTPELEQADEKPFDEPKVEGPQPVEAARPVVKRPNSGRFMDVVHPSSDMKTPSSTPSLVVPDRAAPVSVPKPVTPPVLESMPVPELSPLPEPVETPQTELTSESETAAKEDPVPLTPFLPDAKVEKRPLGGSSSPKQEESETDEAPEKSPILDEPNPAEENALEIAEIESINSERVEDKKDGDEQRPLDPKDFTSTLTPEEQKLKSIESVEVTETSPLNSESIRKVESGDTESVADGDADAKQADEKSKDKNDTDAKDGEGGIYDVHEYHQALAHPVKQKSGWGVVVVIVVIILVCVAVAGAAYYFLTTHS